MALSTKNTTASRIRAYLRDNPKARPDVVAAALGIKRENVYSLRQYDRQRAKRLRMAKKTNPIMAVTDTGAAAMPIVMFDSVDNVNHPEHYKIGGIETIDFIKAKLTPEEFKGYLKGNVLKYASRAGHKNNAVEDAGKLAWYANRLSKES